LASHQLESALGLEFRDRELLEQALVHRSFVNEEGWAISDSYERMEYLGDAVLELTISDELYRRCPEWTEGELTKGRSALVRRQTLAQVARNHHLGNFIRLGKGEEANGGRSRDSILAAAFESVVAAVYLDRGYTAAQQFVLKVMAGELEAYLCRGKPQEDPKSHLQEYVQARGQSAPRYRLVSSEGPAHGPVFTVEVLVDDEVMGTGNGGSKSGAERVAASGALARLAAESSS
jgi:ribonuclease-3